MVSPRSCWHDPRLLLLGPPARELNCLPVQAVDSLEEAIALANDSEYGLTSSIYTRDLSAALKASRELKFGETYINRENFEAIQGFHAGRRNSGIGGADGKHGL